MDKRTYLVRASAIALLLWGSVAAVIIVAQRPAPSADTGRDLVAQGSPE